ncbi:hypothetical protein ACJJTC_005045, partial [Scirpophaga incertulas]
MPSGKSQVGGEVGRRAGPSGRWPLAPACVPGRGAAAGARAARRGGGTRGLGAAARGREGNSYKPNIRAEGRLAGPGLGWSKISLLIKKLGKGTVENVSLPNLYGIPSRPEGLVAPGRVGQASGRDACVGALCRLALPAQYCVPGVGALPCPWRREPPPPDAELRHHVVWVGTPLPSAAPPQGQQQSFVMVTSRHVTAMKALLCAATRDGDSMQEAWLPVLTTLQHLVWILGLKPSTGGSMKASRSSADANAVMSTSAVMADLPALSAMLSRVFEASKNLDDVALHHLIDALCKLSNEAMELAYSNREPSLFAVAKLLETGLANMHRIEVMWRPITNHLLEVCQHPHIRMREWGVEAITYLVQAAFQYHHSHPHLVTEARQRILLEPLSELCAVRHCDVRARQLECAARLLHSVGDQLGAAWPLMVDLICAISAHHSPQLVRAAFQCAQVVGGDLLGCAGPRCLRRVLRAAHAFAAQPRDLNVSLTAVGLMWNISDYLYHNRDKLAAALARDNAVCPEVPQHADLPPLDRLWMCLYIRLSELCTEPRAPVRRAASQTLFSCIGAHGSLLSAGGWRALLAVLFPMLDQVQKQSNIASSEKVDTGEHILIHHTRNTAQKQWAETQVLTLSGVSRVFHSRFQLLTTVGDFHRSWVALLEYITDFALRRSHEVSVAALKSFQEVVTAAGARHRGRGRGRRRGGRRGGGAAPPRVGGGLAGLGQHRRRRAQLRARGGGRQAAGGVRAFTELPHHTGADLPAHLPTNPVYVYGGRRGEAGRVPVQRVPHRARHHAH